MKLKQIYLTISFLFLFQGINFAQDLTQYYLTRTPQSLNINPAFVPKSRIYVSIPVLSNIQFGVSNAFSYNDVFKNGTGLQADSLVFDYLGWLKKLKKNNTLSADLQTTLLGFGFRVQNMYYSFDISTKVSVRCLYPKDMFRILENYGNVGDDNPLDMSKLRLSATAYNQLGLGFAMEINDQLTVGGKLKYLQGIANIDVKLAQKFYTSSVGFDYAMKGTREIRMSYPADVSLKNDSTYDKTTTKTVDVLNDFIVNKNRGLGIDLGAEYKLDDKFSFSASLLDVGFIRWKSNVTQISCNSDIPYTLPLIIINDQLSDTNLKDIMNAQGDTIEKYSKLVKKTSSYTTFLSARLNLGALYTLNEKVNFGALTAFQFYNKTVLPSVTLSANVNPVKWFGASLSYSYANYSFRNLGLGGVLKMGAVQCYAVSDAFFNPIWLKDTRMLNFRVGMNLLFGNKVKVDKALIDEL